VPLNSACNPSIPRSLEAWEVRSLQVNNKTPLEEWFPFSVENAKRAEVLGRIFSEKQKNLAFLHDHTPNAKPYPAE
jgi:hypothetical protein